jgi:hypothetical protein
MTIINDESNAVSEQSFQLIDNAKGVIYDRRMFIIQVTGLKTKVSKFTPKKFYEIDPCIQFLKLKLNLNFSFSWGYLFYKPSFLNERKVKILQIYC